MTNFDRKNVIQKITDSYVNRSLFVVLNGLQKNQEK